MAVAQAKAQGIVTGAIMGIRSNLVVVGFILVTLLGAVNYYKGNHNSNQIDKVWEHSANWVHKSDFTNAVNSILITNEPPAGTMP